MSIMDKITLCLDDRNVAAVRVICLDLSKAFDSLPINRLINYLSSRGINQGFLSWLTNYLTSRILCVKLDHACGESFLTPSGVPQGSVLGPYLFAAYMGCISFNTFGSTHSIQYADDVTLVESIPRNNYVKEFTFSDINRKFLQAGLHLNETKCKEMLLCRSPGIAQEISEIVKRVGFMRILGVTLADNMSWSAHLSDIVKRASRRLFIVRCLRRILSREELIMVYHSLVTSLFLYASPVFGNAPQSFFVKLENFQKRAHKLICGSSCKCEGFPKLSDVYTEAGIKFLRSCHVNKDHPLHNFIPECLPLTGHYRLPYCATTRRLNSFLPYYCLKMNERSY